MFALTLREHPQVLYKMKADQSKNNSPTAHLILDKPLVEKKMDLMIPAGQSYYEVLKQYITKPGVAYVVLVNGLVVDMQEEIRPDDEIRCVPQIIGG